MKMKRFAAMAAVSMLGIQLMGLGTAFADPISDSDCDFGSDNLEITMGEGNGPGNKADVALYIDDDGMLVCDPFGTASMQAVSTIDSITVEMDDDESDGELTIELDDTNSDASEWPEFDTFDIDVTTPLYIDGDQVGDAAGNSLDIVFGASTFSFSGTSGTYSAPKLVIDGGADKDEIDASKATVRVVADGNDEDDLVKGGSGNDDLNQTGTPGDDGDIVYGNGGNDVIDSSATDGIYQAWGGEGSDDLTGVVVAPGAGNDDVVAALMVTYADLTEGVEYELGDTGGAAGDDDFDGSTFVRLYGSQGDDVLVFGTDDGDGARIVGNGGDDVIKCGGCIGTGYASGGAGDDLVAELGYVPLDDDPDANCSNVEGEWCSGLDNVFYGNAGDDVLRGKGGADTLRGGPGKDQAWGGSQPDTCTAEVTNRCEYGKL